MGCLSSGGKASIAPGELNLLLKGKTEQQKKVIKYFLTEGGCLSVIGIGKTISDDEYERLVFSRRNSVDFRAKAISKIGLDEDQIKEIPPARFEGYVFENSYAKRTKKGKWVSSSYKVVWLFFSSTQVYVYEHTFHMDSDDVSEGTDEFFYKDITSFSTASITETARGLGDKKFEVQTNMFKMVVPGDQMTVPMEGVKDSEAIIQAMKQQLREKKTE
jgi:hypothetical protein